MEMLQEYLRIGLIELSSVLGKMLLAFGFCQPFFKSCSEPQAANIYDVLLNRAQLNLPA